MTLKTISGFRRTFEAARHGTAIQFRATGFKHDMPQLQAPVPAFRPSPAPGA